MESVFKSFLRNRNELLPVKLTSLIHVNCTFLYRIKFCYARCEYFDKAENYQPILWVKESLERIIFAFIQVTSGELLSLEFHELWSSSVLPVRPTKIKRHTHRRNFDLIVNAINIKRQANCEWDSIIGLFESMYLALILDKMF